MENAGPGGLSKANEGGKGAGELVVEERVAGDMAADDMVATMQGRAGAGKAHGTQTHGDERSEGHLDGAKI